MIRAVLHLRNMTKNWEKWYQSGWSRAPGQTLHINLQEQTLLQSTWSSFCESNILLGVLALNDVTYKSSINPDSAGQQMGAHWKNALQRPQPCFLLEKKLLGQFSWKTKGNPVTAEICTLLWGNSLHLGIKSFLEIESCSSFLGTQLWWIWSAAAGWGKLSFLSLSKSLICWQSITSARVRGGWRLSRSPQTALIDWIKWEALGWVWSKCFQEHQGRMCCKHCWAVRSVLQICTMLLWQCPLHIWPWAELPKMDKVTISHFFW